MTVKNATVLLPERSITIEQHSGELHLGSVLDSIHIQLESGTSAQLRSSLGWQKFLLK